MRELVESRAVTLTPDPTQDAVDRYGRSLFYVDRSDGLDVGDEMLSRGWADIYYFQDFARLAEYEVASSDASALDLGVWRLCHGEFHKDQADLKRDEAKAFVRLYYRRISNRQFLSAWSMLGARRKAQVRPYSRWKSGFRGSLGVSVLAARSRLAGPRRAVITVRLRSRDRDVCSHKTVRQRFYGNVILAPHRDVWLIIKFRIRKTGGGTPRTSKSDCSPPPTGGGGGGGNTCDPNYSGCLDPNASDYDCIDGGGNGPKYTGEVRVLGDDHYDLDADGDGIGCDGQGGGGGGAWWWRRRRPKLPGL